mgnify:CR=1 FL=1
MLERIATYANLDPAMDSNARYPPRLCHPRTRTKIRDRLSNWLVNPQREWNMIWFHGPAGTGKSAIAQTFAELCAENARLGASFFYSRPNECNDPNTVVPSLVYQLAVCHPEYKSLVTAQLVNDPKLLRKTQRAQFKKLIVEPFSLLHRPEPDIKYLFSRAELAVNCGREELAIDAVSIADVDLYLQNGLAGIKERFWDATTPTWPSEE